MQRQIVWRNKPQAEDPCVATFGLGDQVNALAVSATRVVGGAVKCVHVYDAATQELLGKLEGASDVKSVAILEGDEERIAAGFADGTLKVWDAGER